MDYRNKMHSRFLKAFRYLEETGIICTSSQGKADNISDVSLALYGTKKYGHIIRKTIDDKRVVSFNEAMAFCKHYGISKKWVLFGEGEMLMQDAIEINYSTKPVQPCYDLCAKFITGLMQRLEDTEVRRLLYTLMENERFKKLFSQTVKLKEPQSPHTIEEINTRASKVEHGVYS